MLRLQYRSHPWLHPDAACEAGNQGLKFLRRYQDLAYESHQLGKALLILQPKAQMAKITVLVYRGAATFFYSSWPQSSDKLWGSWKAFGEVWHGFVALESPGGPWGALGYHGVPKRVQKRKSFPRRKLVSPESGMTT